MFLYPTFFRSVNESSGLYLETLVNYAELSFTTQLHGGFGNLSLSVNGSYDDSIRRYRDFIGAHNVLFDLWGRRIFEGRVQDTSLSGLSLSLNTDGYYACGRDEIMGYIYSTPTTVTQVIKDCIGAVEGTGDTNIWREKFAFVVNDANIDITALGAKDYTQTKVSEVIEEVCKLGYKTTDARPLYFAIWDNRLPSFWAEPDIYNIGSVRSKNCQYWFLNDYNLTDIDISLSRSTVFNKVYGTYDGPAGTILTDPAEDKTSQWRYGQRVGIISVGSIPEAVAEGLRDYAISRYSFPRQTYRFGVRGIIKNASGLYDYPFRIRAGDVISITTFDPMLSHFDGEYGEAPAGISGMVVQTSYSIGDGICQVEITSKDNKLDMLLTRLGIGGSLS